MSSTVSPAPNPITAAQNSNSAASTSASGTTSPLSAVPAQPTARSYANATKKQLTPPAIASSSPQGAGGGSQPVQHGKLNSISPVNGKTSIPPAVPVPSVAPAIVNSSGIANGSPVPAEHTRKSSVTISSSQGYVPNGGSAANNNRASITFGSINAGGSPAIANSVPHNPQTTTLSTPPISNPRITSPAHSPSPIPTPAASGGRPPSSLPGQGVVFGSTGGDNSEAMRAVSMPQGPAASLAPQSQHLRQESSQSSHSDMGAGGMNNMNRGFNPAANRGGRNFQPGYPQMGQPSPIPQPAQLHPQQQRAGFRPMQPYQQPGVPVRHPSSPFQANRSPAMGTVQPQMANGAPMVYSYHTPHLQPQPQVGYGMPQFDPAYGYQYNAGPYMHPGMQYPVAPPSPRPQYNAAAHAPQQPYMQGQYGPPAHAQGMARTPSQGSERPSSTINQTPTPSMPSMQSITSHTPSQSSASPAPAAAANFTIPAKAKSRGIVIKNAAGEVVTFDKQTASAPPTSATQPQPPAVVSSTPTPPPKSATPQQPQSDKESHPSKTKEEIEAEFREKVLRAQKGEDAEVKEEPAKPTEAAAAEVEVEVATDSTKVDSKPDDAEEQEEEAPKADEGPKEESEEDKKKREEEELERMIAEMEAAEKEEEERQKQYEEKKKQDAAEKAKKEAESKDEDLKRQELEAEALEEAREKAREGGAAADDDSEDAKKLFASLKKPTLGPGALAPSAEGSGATTPLSDVATPPPTQPQTQTPSIKTPATAGKPKPAALKLETHKPVEPAQPTAGMQSLKSARFLAVKEDVQYPEGIKSPNPSLNVSGRGKGRQYDKSFLLQFQEIFKEKPSVDWDSKVKETVGDGSTDSARPQSARTPSGMGRQASRGGIGGPMGAPQMGSFGAGPGRTLPPGTNSMDRFRMSSQGPGSSMPPQGLGNFSRPPSSFNQAPLMARNPSASGFQPARPMDSPRTGSSRGGRGSKRGNPREEAEAAKKMPLTAGQDLKPLENSGSGWKSTSLGPASGPNPLPGGRMAPDMVQRKVKSALNKMTPEKFDKISDDILQIAAQSKDESDGRTLRQVIQLTFEKATDEAHWASMYAKFCKRMLETMSTDIRDENVKDKNNNPVVGGALFRKYLLNRCQEEFERGWEVNLPHKPEGQSEETVMLSDEYYVAAAAKRRGLGLIQFIGELFKLQMLTARIMHECVLKLLNFNGLPDESAIESLVKLLRTIGATMNDLGDQGKTMINMYFERITAITAMDGLPSRLQFMLMDVIDLRRKNWRSKDDAKGPKTITEIHEEAAAAHATAEMERQRNQQRPGGSRLPMGRGDARSFSGGGQMPPPDYPRNQVNMADLKTLTRGTSRNVSSGPGNFGPSSLLSGSRSNSGRKGLGPGSARAGEDSGMSSRTGTPPAEKKELTTSANAFSALAGLDASGEGADDVASPPSAASSPPVVKSTLAAADAGAHARSKSPAVGEAKTHGADGAGES